ncbi:hypothetical protein [Deinococcus radiophilus]|uniref:Uncharacterized protein n=3 Tax=Deinococcaceae TaxID=183710 RepID=F0RQI8_DEIPM|nr:hypothetical protein [Deinococcus radiophilus]ADY27547.1 hypothetical protein Deipr_2428 [Deinococcus proteolyticus MRP]UFA52015.1 hypothetical protein LMT64_13560 [Deinococcus radiophilus]GHG12399.1 hypothetical protein GCM10017783_25630 [Deinococcus piscis]
MRASERRSVLWLLAAIVLTAGLAYAWWQTIGHWQTALYCIGRKGTVWNGLFAVPAGMKPQCPQSPSYRQEVRDGQTRVEQYRIQGWQPRSLIEPLKQAGFAQLEDEIEGPNHYSVFMGRNAPAELFYTAVADGQDTLITLSGK